MADPRSAMAAPNGTSMKRANENAFQVPDMTGTKRSRIDAAAGQSTTNSAAAGSRAQMMPSSDLDDDFFMNHMDEVEAMESQFTQRRHSTQKPLVTEDRTIRPGHDGRSIMPPPLNQRHHHRTLSTTNTATTSSSSDHNLRHALVPGSNENHAARLVSDGEYFPIEEVRQSLDYYHEYKRRSQREKKRLEDEAQKLNERVRELEEGLRTKQGEVDNLRSNVQALNKEKSGWTRQHNVADLTRMAEMEALKKDRDKTVAQLKTELEFVQQESEGHKERLRMLETKRKKEVQQQLTNGLAAAQCSAGASMNDSATMVRANAPRYSSGPAFPSRSTFYRGVGIGGTSTQPANRTSAPEPRHHQEEVAAIPMEIDQQPPIRIDDQQHQQHRTIEMEDRAPIGIECGVQTDDVAPVQSPAAAQLQIVFVEKLRIKRTRRAELQRCLAEMSATRLDTSQCLDEHKIMTIIGGM